MKQKLIGEVRPYYRKFEKITLQKLKMKQFLLTEVIKFAMF